MTTETTQAAPVMTSSPEVSPAVSPIFTATFSIVVTGIKTATINGLADCVKEVSWTLKGEESGATFELPQNTVLNDARADNFIPLSSLTTEIVSGWIESGEENLISIKSHIQFVLSKQSATASLTTVPMPWDPVLPVEPVSS